MAVEELPLVDVNVETAEHTWPLLLRAVEQADFVALDLVRLVPHEPRTLHLALAFSGVAASEYWTCSVLWSIEDPLQCTVQQCTRLTCALQTILHHSVVLCAGAQWPGRQKEMWRDVSEECSVEGPLFVLIATSPSPSSLEDRYKVLREVAETRAVLSLGVACFQWGACDSGHVDCRVEVFNVWLLCQESYTIDPSSATFLLQHGFDFNKQFARGLPYSPSTREVCA